MIDLTSPAVIREVTSRHGFTFTKSLGQNFITSGSVLSRMIEISGIDGETGVLEIGPGIGTLTGRLAESAARVAAVEIDRSLIPILNETLSGFDNVRIINADILKLNLAELCRNELPYKKLVVCANLPYYITTQVVLLLLESKLFGSITLLLQKEAVERLCASPGGEGYCAASVIIGYYSTSKLCFEVAAGCFIPQPTVSSAVLSLMPKRETPGKEHERVYLSVVNAAFAQRRKTLQNALTAAGLCSRDAAYEIIEACGFSPKIRGEALNSEEFSTLTDKLINLRREV